MTSEFDGFSRRLKSQAHAHRRALDAFIRCREKEEPDLDPAKLRHACDGYIGWSGEVTEAAHRSLSRRGLSSLAGDLAEKAQAVLDLARSKPTQGPRGLPALLRGAIGLHCHVLLLNDGESPIVRGDLQTPLQTALVLVGEPEAVAIEAETRAQGMAIAVMAILDIAAFDAKALALPPIEIPAFSLESLPESVEPAPAVSTLPARARALNATEGALAGHWVYEEFYSGGHSELHMALLSDGRCLRSARSMVSVTFNDGMGNWAGHMGATSGLAPDEHGEWSCNSGLLSLDMADGSAYEYRVSLSGSSMVTVNTTGGSRRLWTRER